MSSLSHNIIFVTGASRSGTTLLSFMLRNHDKIYGLKELQYFGEFWDPKEGRGSMDRNQMEVVAATMLARDKQGILSYKPGLDEKRQARAILQSSPEEDRNPAGLFAMVVEYLANKADKSIPCEQTPRNIFYADELLRIYPNAQVVHMIRDPRAVLASQKQRWKRRFLAVDKRNIPRLQSVRLWVNYHPYTICKLWSRSTGIAQRLSKHPRFTCVRFEDVLEEPKRTLRFLCNRLGIDFQSSMLEVSQINSSHQTSVGGARKGLNRTAIDKWQSTLTDGEVSIVNKICGKDMEAFDYNLDCEPLTNMHKEYLYKFSYPFHLAGVFIVNPKRAWIQLKAVFKHKKRRTGLA